jgi:ribonuclease HI
MTVRKKARPPVENLRFFTDGRGSRPDGKGSAIAYLREDTGQTYMVPIDGMTNNEAEYKSIHAALESASHHANVEIKTDSQLVCYQLIGTFRVNNPALELLRTTILKTIADRHLSVTFTWIPRNQNRADKCLRQGQQPSSEATRRTA